LKADAQEKRFAPAFRADSDDRSTGGEAMCGQAAGSYLVIALLVLAGAPLAIGIWQGIRGAPAGSTVCLIAGSLIVFAGFAPTVMPSLDVMDDGPGLFHAARRLGPVLVLAGLLLSRKVVSPPKWVGVSVILCFFGAAAWVAMACL